MTAPTEAEILETMEREIEEAIVKARRALRDRGVTKRRGLAR